jgi:chemotaxis protein methyltransferase CheR
MLTVTINETNDIIHGLAQNYGIDLSGMAMASLRLKISRFCRDHGLLPPGSLITRLVDEPGLTEPFIFSISSASPEVFHDPELWIVLRDQVLPGMIQDSNMAGILIPEIASPEEICSISILLKESGLEKHFRITATYFNEYARDQILNKPLPKGRYRICQENYAFFNPGFSLDEYFRLKDGKYHCKPGLLNPMNLSLRKNHPFVLDEDYKLILYRNRLIYQNLEQSRSQIRRIFDPAAEGTIFVIGIKESIDNLGLQDRVHVISPDFNIYSKAG